MNCDENDWKPMVDEETEAFRRKQERKMKKVFAVCAVIAVLIVFGQRRESPKTSDRPASRATVAAATAAPGSAAEAVKNGTLTMADIKHRADALGWSTEAWQEWYYIASQKGVPMESIEAAAKNINDQLAARDPEFLDALADIGITEKTAKTMKPEELFEKVITALQK